MNPVECVEWLWPRKLRLLIQRQKGMHPANGVIIAHERVRTHASDANWTALSNAILEYERLEKGVERVSI